MFLIGSTYFFKSIDGFTSKDIDILELIRDKLDDKHLYEAIIFDSYIENNAFKLSNEQLLKAYDVYKKYR